MLHNFYIWHPRYDVTVLYLLDILFTGLRPPKCLVGTLLSFGQRVMDLHTKFRHILSGNTKTFVWLTACPITDSFDKGNRYYACLNAIFIFFLITF